MTFPNPGEILLEGHEGEHYTEQYDHVDPTEYGVRCVTLEDTENGHKSPTEKVYYPWHRVEMVTKHLGENDA